MVKADHPLADVYGRPGFMIRRAHQIAEALFAEECIAFNLTTTQHGVLRVVSRMPGIDQTAIGRLLGLDKSTVALVVRNLAKRNLLMRLPDEGDFRRHHIELSAAGGRLLKQVENSVERARERFISPFSAAECRTFVALLDRLVQAFNEVTRAPLDDRPLFEAALRDRKNHLRRKRKAP